MTDIIEATAKFEALFDNVEYTTVYAPDIVEMLCGGIKGEGERTPVWCGNEATATRLWFEAASRYKSETTGGTLVWRIKPEVTGHVFHYESFASSPEGGLEPVILYKAYSRFAIRENKPDYMAAVRDMAKA